MISAKIIADSISNKGNRLTTFELEYPRFIHSELMTHRMFSRNAASSRAIPISKMMKQVLEAPATPVEWGINKAGMQAEELHSDSEKCIAVWNKAAKRAVESAQELKDLDLHKQLVNRVLEPFQVMKTIVTATEFDNYFWLRCHPDAQPEIRTLANIMWHKYAENKPSLLGFGEWHLPYIQSHNGQYFNTDDQHRTKGELTLEEAQKISASCCAQVSYRKLDDGLDKAVKIYNQLVTMVPVHASPLEHIGTPIYDQRDDTCTHEDNDGNLWSGNLKGWTQYRQAIPGNNCTSYESETL
jgi:thymidylate synthase ThyX